MQSGWRDQNILQSFSVFVTTDIVDKLLIVTVSVKHKGLKWQLHTVKSSLTALIFSGSNSVIITEKDCTLRERSFFSSQLFTEKKFLQPNSPSGFLNYRVSHPIMQRGFRKSF